MSGFFISFEGGEGSGKTTQINRLAEALTTAGHKVVTTREPGGTPEGEKIRDFIVQREGGNWSPMAEILLFSAARTMLVENIIKPSLEDGKVVITDRFIDSTVAYQGYGRGHDLEQIEALNALVLGDFRPNLTFILDIDAKTGLARAQQRLSAETADNEFAEDRFERLDEEFHEQLRQGFLDIAQKEPERCSIIDAARDIDAMAEQIKDIALERLS